MQFKGTKAAVPTPVQAPSPVVTVDPGATPAPDSGSYYIEPHGTNATTATATTTTKSYALFYATYKPTAKVVPLLNPGEGPFFTSDRITLVTLVSVLCTAVR